MRSFSWQAGQSLIEVTFATAVVSLVLVALLSSVIQSLSNSRVSLEQTRSSQYAQEVLEWLRRTRDNEGWGEFYTNISSVGSSLTYCLPTVATDSAALIGLNEGACSELQVISGTSFRRELDLEVLSPTQIQATARVIRPGRSGTIITSLETLLGDWQ